MAAPDEPTSAAPSQPDPSITTQPDPSITTQPDPSITTQPDPSITTQPDPSITTQPDPSLTTQPDPSITTQPDPSLTTQPTYNNANMFFNLTQLGLLDPIKSVLKPDSQSKPSCLAHTLSPKPLPEHNGSYRKYVDIMRKHQRNAKGPNDLYSHPLTSSQTYGRWLLEQPQNSSRDDSWTNNPGKFYHRNSEMTRFVDDMALTNKDFSLY